MWVDLTNMHDLKTWIKPVNQLYVLQELTRLTMNPGPGYTGRSRVSSSDIVADCSCGDEGL